MSVYCFENKQISSIYDETSNVFAITGKDTAFDTTLRNHW